MESIIENGYEVQESIWVSPSLKVESSWDCILYLYNGSRLVRKIAALKDRTYLVAAVMDPKKKMVIIVQETQTEWWRDGFLDYDGYINEFKNYMPLVIYLRLPDLAEIYRHTFTELSNWGGFYFSLQKTRLMKVGDEYKLDFRYSVLWRGLSVRLKMIWDMGRCELSVYDEEERKIEISRESLVEYLISMG